MSRTVVERILIVRPSKSTTSSFALAVSEHRTEALAYASLDRNAWSEAYKGASVIRTLQSSLIIDIGAWDVLPTVRPAKAAVVGVDPAILETVTK